MPGTTTNFGIRYPCSGETIDPTVFANWADDIDAAMFSVTSASAATLNRPRASVKTADAGTSTAAGVTTTLVVGTTTLYADRVTVTPTGLNPDAPGIYMVNAEFSPLTAVTTLTSWAGAVFGAGTDGFGRKLGISAANTIATNINISGLLPLAPPFGVGVTWTWTGTGGPMFVYCNLSIALVCEI